MRKSANYVARFVLSYSQAYWTGEAITCVPSSLVVWSRVLTIETSLHVLQNDLFHYPSHLKQNVQMDSDRPFLWIIGSRLHRLPPQSPLGKGFLGFPHEPRRMQPSPQGDWNSSFQTNSSYECSSQMSYIPRRGKLTSTKFSSSIKSGSVAAISSFFDSNVMLRCHLSWLVSPAQTLACD